MTKTKITEYASNGLTVAQYRVYASLVAEHGVAGAYRLARKVN